MDSFTYKLFRYSSQAESTHGLLMAGSMEIGRSFRCFTLEDEKREVKVPGETRIPAGTYEIKLRAAGGLWERKKEAWGCHRGQLHLQDVPGFTWIYIHPGNRDRDTDGCILVGDVAVSNLPRVGQGSISSSLAAYRALYDEIVFLIDQGKRVFIEISDIA